MAELTLVEAVNGALARAMQDDPAVIVLGEDVGRDGGVFRATEGLVERFGAERVLDTPVAEAAIAGIAIGMAAHGLRPVAELQFDGAPVPRRIGPQFALCRHGQRGARARRILPYQSQCSNR